MGKKKKIKKKKRIKKIKKKQEKVAVKKLVGQSNFKTGDEKAQIKKIKIQDSICVLKEPSYELFEERVLKILSITNEEYFRQLGKEKSFIMLPSVETANIMRKRLKEIVA